MIDLAQELENWEIANIANIANSGTWNLAIYSESVSRDEVISKIRDERPDLELIFDVNSALKSKVAHRNANKVKSVFITGNPHEHGIRDLVANNHFTGLAVIIIVNLDLHDSPIEFPLEMPLAVHVNSLRVSMATFVKALERM